MKLRGLLTVLTGVAAALAVGWFVFPRVLYSTETQPVAFSHKVHTEKAGMKCDDCHSLDEAGVFHGVPKLEKCSGCHAAPMTQSAAEKALIDKYVTPNQEIPWRVYARQPDNVHFSHAAHKKLKCELCHGGMGASTSLPEYQQNRITGYSRDIWGQSISRLGQNERPAMKMDDCLECHRERRVETSCISCHR